MEIRPIGKIHSPFRRKQDAPIQPFRSKARGKITVFKKYQKGLRELDGFSHIIILYWFNRTERSELLVKPFLVDEKKGVFATRAPWRPNRIGLSIVRLKRMDGNVLTVEGIDALDGTPLLDIKPYVPGFDAKGKVRIGWLAGRI